MCLQEVKAIVVSDARCFSLWGDSNIGWIHNEGVNGAGSTLSLWHKDAFSYGSHLMGKGFIAIFGQHIQSKLKCVVINIYAACTVKDKLALWDDLTNVKNAYQNIAWVLCGDFNAVRCGDERKGTCATSTQRKEIVGFNDFIERNFLVELPIVGKRYTWFKANGSAKSRLDRVLVSNEWLLKWPRCKQYVQPRVVLDHCAIVVKSVVKDWGPKPFRSIDTWFLEPGFLAMVKEKWDSYSMQGNYFSRLKDKLKNLKADLKVWNRDVFGCMETNKKKILKEIDDLDTQDDCADLDDCEKQKRWAVSYTHLTLPTE